MSNYGKFYFGNQLEFIIKDLLESINFSRKDFYNG